MAGIHGSHLIYAWCAWEGYDLCSFFIPTQRYDVYLIHSIQDYHWDNFTIASLLVKRPCPLTVGNVSLDIFTHAHRT